VGEGAIQKFIKLATEGKDLEIYGDGSQVRSWCFVADFVEGILQCLERDEAVGEVFNLGNPQTGITTAELAQMIIRLAGSKSKIVFRKPLPADVHVRIPSIQKAQEILGFRPRVDLATGIVRTLEWQRSKVS
jgi:nucleoside-diphosphate-sugar epimerase